MADGETPGAGRMVEAARLIDTLQGFVLGDVKLTDAEADAAMRRLDEVLPDLPPIETGRE